MFQFPYEQPNQVTHHIDAKQFDTLGEMLKTMRLSKGETQSTLAKKLGTCRQHVQKWEYNYIRPTPKRLGQIFELLNYRKPIEVFRMFY